jgi:hypothetical protein
MGELEASSIIIQESKEQVNEIYERLQAAGYSLCFGSIE